MGVVTELLKKGASAGSKAAPKSILSVDIGGSKVKMLMTGQTEPTRFDSGPRMTPQAMCDAIKDMSEGWGYEAVSMGYPGLVGDAGPRSEPMNLGKGWVGFDFPAALGCPVRMINDAAMQALGSYDGGRMLFLGLGTGLGSTLIAENVIVTLELGDLPYDRKRTMSAVLSRRALDKLGKTKWRAAVDRCVALLTRAFVVDYVVLGGGNARKIKVLPPGARMGHNLTAFRGGARLWNVEDVSTLAPHGEEKSGVVKPPAATDWRLI